MRKNNKQFVRNVIITSVVGLITLMVVLFIVLQSYLAREDHKLNLQQQDKVVSSNLAVSESLLVLVHNITENNIIGYDVKNNKSVSKQILDTTRVSDAYGNVIPLDQIKVGDIVELDYQQDKRQLMAISKASEIQSWKKISGVIVDTILQQVNVGGTSYNYNANTLHIDSEGKPVLMNNIGPYDVVSIQVYKDTIWSLTVDEAAATINMLDFPISSGTVEIDYSRLLSFVDINEPIKIIPGKHKIVVKMEGYETATFDINVQSGEVYELSLKNIRRAYTLLKVNMGTGISNYQIKIKDQIYGPGDEINLLQDQYRIEIEAEGYEKWAKVVKLNKEKYILNVTMKAVEEESEETETEEDGKRTITLTTDPSGAKVYIDGTLRGQTPYTVTVETGSHTVVFEKNGYAIYNADIQLDSKNDQTVFLYVLTKSDESE